MSNFHFDISLSILNHLWRNLYRNFITVIWEAISNSWDADANNVYIYIDANSLTVLDDGKWMNDEEFQDRFLNIWYSKRDEFWSISEWKRPFIWRKWIWKLALLSCAQRIHILSKKDWHNLVWGVIDNSILDEKIKANLKTEQYPLGEIDNNLFLNHHIASKFGNGTFIHFENLNEWIKNNLAVIRKLIVLNFRFSLLDPKFNIFVNDKIIWFEDIKDLSENTQFLWKINNFEDEYYSTLSGLKEQENINIKWIAINGFIASIKLPSALNIYWVWEKTWIDLFVNWRLRESNILKNSKTGFSSRIVASYLYGQIHINDLDDENDRFTSSREWIKPWDEKYWKYLETIEKTILSHIAREWDEWRKKHKEIWDIENGNMPKFQALMEQSKDKREKDFEDKLDEIDIDEGIKKSLKESLKKQSSNNTSIYQDFYILENLFREYIRLKGITLESLSKKMPWDSIIKKLIEDFARIKELRNKDEELHELKWKVVKYNNELNYADIVYLWMLVDLANSSAPSWRGKPITMESHSKDVLPIRNPIMHTNEITDEAYNWDKIRNMIDYIEKLADTESK